MVSIGGSSNYSTSLLLYLRTQHAGGIESVSSWWHSYFKFNLSSLPVNATITGATLSLYGTNSGFGTNRYVVVYNVSNGWSEENTTLWTDRPTISALQSNTTVDYTAVGWKNFNVTNAVIAKYGSELISFGAWDTVENDTADGGKAHYMQLASKEFGITSERPKLTVEYSYNDCVASCGACGCTPDGGCNVPTIIGSYCSDPMPGANKIITTTNASCISTDFTCPGDTVCQQVTPLVNITTPIVENVTDCSACFYVYTTALGFFPILIHTNCPNNPECNPGIGMSNNTFTSNCLWGPLNPILVSCPGVFVTPTSEINGTIERWTAGCLNKLTGVISPVIDSNGVNTSIYNLTVEAFGENTTIANASRSQCPTNTTTQCYDSTCGPVTCAGTQTSIDTSYGAQFESLIGYKGASMITGFFASTTLGLAIFLFIKSKKLENFLVPFLVFLTFFALPGIGFFPIWVLLLEGFLIGILVFFKVKG